MMCGTMEEGAVKKGKAVVFAGKETSCSEIGVHQNPFLGRVLSEDARDLELKKDR